MGRSKWSDLFHSRLYLGETWLKEGDVPVKGTHQPLVDEATFTEVQQVLRAHDKNRQRTRRHKYLLRGILHSVEADSQCWAETNNKKQLSYYRSRQKLNGAQVFYNSRTVEGQLPAVFKSITISEQARRDLRKQLADWFEAEANGSEELKKAEARLAKLERMEKNLQRLVIEEEIPHQDFKEHRAQIEAERSRLRNTVDAIRQRQHLVKADFEIALQLATELDFLFEKGNYDEKRLICETVFKRLYVEKGKITKTELNAPFALIARSASGSGTVTNGGPLGTVSELLFEKKQLIPELQQLLLSRG